MRRLIQRWREWRRKSYEDNAALAIMVYMTWSGGHGPLPDLSLQKWCNKQLRRKMFPETEPEA